MLTREIIQRIQSLYSKGVQSDDTRLSKRHIYNKLISVRSRLIYQKVNKKQKLSQWAYQTLPCVELIKAPIQECHCITKDCKVLRTKYKLPKPISSISKDIIQSVATLDGSKIFNETTFETEKYNNGNKYTGKNPSYYIRNEYLYLTNIKTLEVITITGLFDNPSEVEEYPSYCTDDIKDCLECNCKSIMDKDFPIDSDLIEPMIELSLKELIEIFNNNREDQTNDTRDNLIQESKS